MKIRELYRRQFLRALGSTALGASLFLVTGKAGAANFIAGNADLNTLSKATAPWSAGYTYLLWKDGQALPWSREYKITGKDSATQVGESDQCVALVKAVTGAPVTTKWKRGRQVTTSNLARGTAIATFPGGVYSGHCGILAGLRSDGSIDLWDQNYGNPFVKRHTLAKTGSGTVSDSAAYYEIVTA